MYLCEANSNSNLLGGWHHPLHLRLPSLWFRLCQKKWLESRRTSFLFSSFWVLGYVMAAFDTCALWQVFTSPHVRMLLLLLPRMMPRHFKLPLCKHMSCEQFVSTGQFCFAGWGLTIQFSHPHSILPNWVVGFFEQWHVNILSVPFPFIKGDKKAHVFEQVPPVPCHLALISPCIQCGHDCSLLVICKYCSKLTVYLFLLRCRRNHFRRIKRLGFDLYTSTWICSTVPIRQCGLLPNIPRLLSSRVPMEHSKVQPLSCT